MLKLERCPKEVVNKDGKHGDWFEIYGETEPTLSSGAGAPAAAGDLYEYCWALGYSKGNFSKLEPKSGPLRRLRRERQRLRRWRRRRDGTTKRAPRWSDEIAARVSLYFPADCNWRVSEILATVKHLSPVEQERSWREEFTKDFNAIEPVIGAAGKLAADATGMPELGSVAEAVGRLKLTSVPQAIGTMWFVRKVNLVDEERSNCLFHGIEWQLSLGLLEQLGTRVAGTLLVSFTSVQLGSEKTGKGEMLADARMYYDRAGDGGQLLNVEKIRLCLEPKQPEPKQPEPKQPAEHTIRVFLEKDPNFRDTIDEAHGRDI